MKIVWDAAWPQNEADKEFRAKKKLKNTTHVSAARTKFDIMKPKPFFWVNTTKLMFSRKKSLSGEEST